MVQLMQSYFPANALLCCTPTRTIGKPDTPQMVQCSSKKSNVFLFAESELCVRRKTPHSQRALFRSR